MTFHANCLQWRQLALNIKSCFSRENKKNSSNVSSPELAQRVVMVNRGVVVLHDGSAAVIICISKVID